MTIQEGAPLIMDDKTNQKYKVPYFYITLRFKKSSLRICQIYELTQYINI